MFRVALDQFCDHNQGILPGIGGPLLQHSHHAATDEFRGIEELFPVKHRLGLVQTLNQQLNDAVFDFDEDTVMFS